MKLKVSDSGFASFTKRKYVITDDEELTIIAAAYGKTEADAEEVANRIASMDDMYEALKEVRMLLQLNPMKSMGDEPWAKRLKEALAKAEGGEEKFEPVVGPDPRD